MKLLLLPLFLATSAMAQQPDSSSALFSMREAEWNFARQSAMYGRNAAFVNNFAEQSVMFTDKWITNARQFWKERKAAPVILKWEPEYMDIAGSRDFGVSTGPWESQEFRPGTAPTSTGYFLTVWEIQSGSWKVVLDAGAGTPAKEQNKHSFEFPAGAEKPVSNSGAVNKDISKAELIARDKEFSAAWIENPLPATFAGFLSEGARLQRNGYLPTSNRDSIAAWTGHLEKKLAWNPSGAGAASSGELGYTYGMLAEQGTVKGHYVRIWRKVQGKWLISIEMSVME
jgi:hypothetical protein